jgi:nucleoside-diphosphate-sugar epimerase
MQIAVVGCGWLGQPLALSLQKSGHNIVATCRSQQKTITLSKLGFDSETFELGDELEHSRLSKLFSSEVLVLNIPVGRKTPKTEHFAQHMQALLKHAANSQIQNLIFISTTSVYGDNSGIITEQSPTYPDTESGQINLAVEAMVRDYFAGRSTIIRPAGLVGKDRHPATYLAGKTALLNPDNSVNLVHQDDVICAIQTVIEKNIWEQTLHLSAQQHPTRAEYYTWAAEKMGLSSPKFVEGTGVALGKKIDATRSLQILGLSLEYSSPFDMLRQ